MATALFQADAQTEIKERFVLVMTYSAQRHRHTASVILTGVFILLLIASYAILPQPKFKAPKSTEPQIIDFNSDTAYIEQNHAGEYWLCIQNEQPMKLTESEAAFFHQTGLAIIKE